MPKITLIALALVMLASTACSRQENIEIEDQPIGQEEYRYVMPEGGKVVHPKYGEEKWFAYGAMSGVGDTPANGVANGQYFEDGTYTLTVQLNIAVPEDGYFYEAWLAGEDPLDIISAGHLVNHFGDSRHQLNFKSDKDLRIFKQVLVTLEADDGNPSPSEQLVAQGLLKQRRR